MTWEGYELETGTYQGKEYGIVFPKKNRISDLYGSPEAVKRMEAFQPFVQEKYGLSTQAILFGFSRGGLYALHYAAEYPERITSLYLDPPVVDIYSWPGGFFLAEGSKTEWEDCKALWNKTHDEFMDIVNSAVRTLLEWSIPLILAGGKDELVPYVIRRIKKCHKCCETVPVAFFV